MSTLKEYLDGFVRDMCLLGNDPNGNPYRADGQYLCAMFNEYTKSKGGPVVTAYGFNKILAESYGAQKRTSGGRNSLIGIAYKDDIATFVPRKFNPMSEATRREARKAYQREYYERRKTKNQQHPLTVAGLPSSAQIAQTISVIEEPFEDEESDEEDNSDIPSGVPPMVPLDQIGNGLRIRPASINNITCLSYPWTPYTTDTPQTPTVRLRIVPSAKSTTL